MAEVVIAGGGPTGLMLAAELKLAGVDVRVVERRPSAELDGSRAGGFHARTIEILDQRGIASRFLDAGTTHPGTALGTPMFDVTDFPTRHPYTLGLWQNHIERILASWVAELGVVIEYGRSVIGFAQDSAGVDVEYDDGETSRCRYLVGADGGRSTIRKLAGIDFPGHEATQTNLIAEVEVRDEPPAGIRKDEAGVHGLSLMENGHTYRVMTTEIAPSSAGEATLDDLKAALVRVFGTDFGVHDPTWISRFSDATRQAASYRAGRVLLAGDAAHIHYPAGGQGIGLGIQDAVNLGWKLAQVVQGVSPESLLDTYHSERHPADERALKQTMVMGVFQRADPRVAAANDLVTELMEIPDARRHVAGLLSGLDVHYDLGEGHPLLGRRMPDLDLTGVDGVVRVFSLLHEARPVLLDLGPGALELGPWADRVRLVRASYDGPWELPVIGEVAPPSAVLIRPDGHVAWVGDGTDDGLRDALGMWFGPAAASDQRDCPRSSLVSEA